MKNRPITTLFMIISVDGKISTGNSDHLDVDKDFPLIDGVKQGLHQYYELEQQTDLWSLNTGRVMQKIGMNEKQNTPSKIPVSFVIIDNQPHLNTQGISYLSQWVKKLVLVTTNQKHPAVSMDLDNVSVIHQEKLDLRELLAVLNTEYGVERLTIQSGGTLNGLFLRDKLLDYVNIVVAPILIGGKDTATLIDGVSITDPAQLDLLSTMKLEECKVLEDSYVLMKYRVIS